MFDSSTVESLLSSLRGGYDGQVVCEPRHVSWFEISADCLLQEYRIARAAVDPAVVPSASQPGGWRGLRYYRLHGSPRIYYSRYDDAFLSRLASEILVSFGECWCIFDNTASGAAVDDALRLRRFMEAELGSPKLEIDLEGALPRQPDGTGLDRQAFADPMPLEFR